MRLSWTQQRTGAICKVDVASTLVERTVGLIGRDGLPQDEGLLIRPCNAIHTGFMRFTIDIAFVSFFRCDHMEIIKLCENVEPWRIAHCKGAEAVIEWQSGFAKAHGLSVGAKLELS